MRFWWSLECLPGGLRGIAFAILSLGLFYAVGCGACRNFSGDYRGGGWREGDCGAFGHGPPAAGLQHAPTEETATAKRTVSCVRQGLAIFAAERLAAQAGMPVLLKSKCNDAGGQSAVRTARAKGTMPRCVPSIGDLGCRVAGVQAEAYATKNYDRRRTQMRSVAGLPRWMRGGR